MTCIIFRRIKVVHKFWRHAVVVDLAIIIGPRHRPSPICYDEPHGRQSGARGRRICCVGPLIPRWWCVPPAFLFEVNPGVVFKPASLYPVGSLRSFRPDFKLVTTRAPKKLSFLYIRHVTICNFHDVLFFAALMFNVGTVPSLFWVRVGLLRSSLVAQLWLTRFLVVFFISAASLRVICEGGAGRVQRCRCGVPFSPPGADGRRIHQHGSSFRAAQAFGEGRGLRRADTGMMVGTRTRPSHCRPCCTYVYSHKYLEAFFFVLFASVWYGVPVESHSFASPFFSRLFFSAPCIQVTSVVLLLCPCVFVTFYHTLALCY